MSLYNLRGNDKVKDVRFWTPIHEVESGAIDQLKRVASLPWVAHHVAVMPDVHVGKGATVGSVIAMRGALSPATVGVDIGCGMGAVRTNLKASDLPESLEALRASIESLIPVGFNKHDEPVFKGGMPVKIKQDGSQLFSDFRTLDNGVQSLLGKAKRQVGTLGGGNHFIELCLDTGKCENCENGSGYTRHVGMSNDEVIEECSDHQTDPRVWMVLHSGSRNIGKELAGIHIAVAQGLSHNQGLPDRDLAVFMAGTPEMKKYRNDLMWAQTYAMFNRRVMFEIYKQTMLMHFPNVTFEDPILAHHNYVSEEVHFGEELIVTRKGAIAAHKGTMGVIPGSMGTKSYIVRGLGNEESFCSASHGAGRRMSRGQAKRTFTVEDVEAQTAGVCCRKDSGIIDEIPGAYKNIDQVMENQKDLVEIVAELKQVLCVKG